MVGLQLQLNKTNKIRFLLLKRMCVLVDLTAVFLHCTCTWCGLPQAFRFARNLRFILKAAIAAFTLLLNIYSTVF